MLPLLILRAVDVKLRVDFENRRYAQGSQCVASCIVWCCKQPKLLSLMFILIYVLVGSVFYA